MNPDLTYRCVNCGATERGCEGARLFASRPCCPDCDHDDGDA